MIYYVKGKVEFIVKNYLVVNVDNIGYQIYVSHPNEFSLKEEVFLFTYEVISELGEQLFGFADIEEKEMFLILLKVKGIGPKTALAILSGTTPNDLKNAILSNNIAYLKTLPAVGIKGANQLILEAKRWINNNKGYVNLFSDVDEALRRLGFSQRQIDEALATINEENLNSDAILRLALRYLNH